MINRRNTLALLGAASASALLPSFGLAQQAIDLSPEQPGRPRGTRDEEAIKLIGKNAKFVKDGVLTVANATGRLPFGGYATDTRTVIGSEPDIAQLVADALGRRLEIVSVSWADWPLGVASGKYDAAISNITVTEQRKEKFDFSTYRQGLHGFFVRADSNVAAIREPKDAAGLSISVGGGTNQERILVEWSKQNVAAGLKPIELQLFDDEAGRLVALRSGRVDAIVQPHAQLVFIAARDKDIKRIGTLSAGWPLKSDVAITTRKGSGLVDALTIATNNLIANGKFRQSLARWQLEEEALQKSETNPPGLPKY